MDVQGISFQDMGLDDRILEAIAALKWREPTLIQEKAIPLALEGKDILARARTGSGKTAAFAIPILQQILQRKLYSSTQETTVLVLAPTKELCKQIHKNILELNRHCRREVYCFDASPEVDLEAQRPLLLEKPDIVVGTLQRILSHMKENNLCITNSLKTLVVDEADLIFSFSCEQDIHDILGYLPSVYQAFLMSATLSAEVRAVKKLVLHNPVVLKLEEPELPESDQLTQYHINCEEADKFVLIYALFKLELIRGKTLMFVKSVDRCYQLKLYLEQFGIRSCVLNSELPAVSRCHAVDQFNAGVFEILIASDARTADAPGIPINNKRKTDKEYGISRGIDFQFVSNVINFDFPTTVEAYIHRVGRTARGNANGTALSFVAAKERDWLKKVEDYFTDAESGKKKANFKPYLFKMEELDSFKYRSEDAFRAVTGIAVREARLKEIKMELLNSKNLKPYFEDNPRDLQLLRHDKALHIVKLHSHLKHVPDYILPPTLRGACSQSKANHRSRNARKQRKLLKKGLCSQQSSDPLKSFHFEAVSKIVRKDKKKKKMKNIK